MTSNTFDIGLIGLGVMGRNLALNIADHGYGVAVYNRTENITREFIKGLEAAQVIQPGYSYAEFASLIRKPRAAIIMVPAGRAVDAVIDELKNVFEPGDLIIDGGNSYFKDTDRRAAKLAEDGFHFFGLGVSGGEEGARYGPSLMPGGPVGAYERIRGVLESAAAKVDGVPCIEYLGPGSSGHYVKMIHNGIEYGLMEILAESYDLLKFGLGLDNSELSEVYADWNRGDLESYLVEITSHIFLEKDEFSDGHLIDRILDKAEQKGTGKWTTEEAMELQSPIPTIDAAENMRNLSILKEERTRAAHRLTDLSGGFLVMNNGFKRLLERAVYTAFIIVYAQGLALLKKASTEYKYGIKLKEVAKIWRGGCIVRAALLDHIQRAYHREPGLPNLLLDEVFSDLILENHPALVQVIKIAADLGVPAPGLVSALWYVDAYRRERLPMNLIQAQRDYFGSHTYRRTDRDGSFHTQWPKE